VPPTAPVEPPPVPPTLPPETPTLPPVPPTLPPETPTLPPVPPTLPPETPTLPPVPPTPEPELKRMALRPEGGGIDGWAWSSDDTLGTTWSNATWHWKETHYRVSTEIASVFGVAVNENSQASAGGRRRFTPPQPSGLWLNIDADLSGVLAVLPGLGSSSKVTVVARIQTTRAGGNEPKVVQEITLYDLELRSSLDAIGDIAQTTVVKEQLRINELIPPLEMGKQYHMELEVRCETETLFAARVGGFCSFGLNELNDSLGVPVPIGTGLILNDAWLSYETNA